MNAKEIYQRFLETVRQEKYARARKLIVFVFGITLFLIGVAMILLPGPAIVVIPLSLAILGTEFVWARLLLKKIKKEAKRIKKVLPQFKKNSSKKSENPLYY